MAGKSVDVLGWLLNDIPGAEFGWLPADSGLTVLYGINGAGKTRILEAVRSVFAGWKSGASLLLQLPDEHPTFGYMHSEFVFNVTHALNPHRASRFAPYDLRNLDGEQFEDVLFEAIGSLLQPSHPDLEDPVPGPFPEDRVERLVEEAFRQRLVVLTPRACLLTRVAR